MTGNVKAATKTLLETSAVVALCCVMSGAAAAKGKPQAIESVFVDIMGGLEAADAVQSHEVTVTGGKKDPVLEIVVRNFDLTFVFRPDSGLDGFDTCFGVSDEGAAGKFILDDDLVAVFEAYPEYLDKNGNLQQYQLILEGNHDYDSGVAGFPASGFVDEVTANFDTIQVSTEGRGKRRDACMGTFDLTDGFAAKATIDR